MKTHVSNELEFPKDLKQSLTMWKLESQDALDIYENSKKTNKISFGLLSQCPGPNGDIIDRSTELMDKMTAW